MKHAISDIYLKDGKTTERIKRVLRFDDEGLYVIFKGKKLRVNGYHGTHYALIYKEEK